MAQRASKQFPLFPTITGFSLACLLAIPGTANAQSAVDDSMPEDSARVVKYTGPVQLMLTTMVIAPGKSTSGLPWDGPGKLPPAVAEGVRNGLAAKVVSRLFHALSVGIPPLAVLNGLERWTIGAFVGGIAAPDIEAVVYVNGKFAMRARKVQDSYTPSWLADTAAVSEPLLLQPHSQIEIRVIDKDLRVDDDVGGCTIQGMPLVDDHGYAVASSFRCNPQIWAVGLRVVPVEPQ